MSDSDVSGSPAQPVPGGEVDPDVAEVLASLPGDERVKPSEIYDASYGRAKVRLLGGLWIVGALVVLLVGGRVGLPPGLVWAGGLLLFVAGLVQVIGGRRWSDLGMGTRVLVLVLVLFVAPILGLLVWSFVVSS